VLDPLTGLLNRTALMSRFEELRQQAAQNGRPIAVIVCDLDHFKDVNDHHGHDRGDVVLREAAYELRKATRSFELIYRIGGEEFLLVLPGVEILEAQEVAERLRKTVASATPGGGSRSPPPSASAPREAPTSSSRSCSERPTRRSTPPRHLVATRWWSPLPPTPLRQHPPTEAARPNA
jgi:GGDEF domain-containing protein